MSKLTKLQRELDYLKSSQTKDKIDLENEKSKFIKEIKGLTKDDIFVAPKKMTLCQRILKVMSF